MQPEQDDQTLGIGRTPTRLENLGTSEFDARTLQKLSAQLQGIGRFIGVLQRTHADSAAFTDLLDASDAVWRAAVALERAAGLSAP